MSTDYQIKQLEIDHLTEMMAIERDVFLSPWSASVMRDSLLAAHTKAWGIYLSDEPNKLVGFAVLSIILDEVELLTMSIAKDYHRQGLGKALMNFIVERAKSKGADKLYLEVNVLNEKAIKLYRTFGFEEIGRREGYYKMPEGERADALVMCLELT